MTHTLPRHHVAARRLLGLVAIAALGLSLTGCGGDPETSAGGTSPADGAVEEQTLTVLAAASLTDVLGEVARDFEADHEGVKVETSFGASSTLVQQVEQGAPADVLALAGTAPLEKLSDTHRAGEVATFATNSLQLAVPQDNPGQVKGVDDLDRDGLRLVVCAEEVPCGSAAAKLFEKLAITPTVASYEPDVRATLTKVELGEADVGIVYRTDVAGAGDRVLGIDIPDDVNVINTYPILAVSDRVLAQAFVDEVMSARGQRHLADAGFVAP